MKHALRLIIVLLACTYTIPSYANETFIEVVKKLQQQPVKSGDFIQQKQLAFLKQPIISTGSFLNQRSTGSLTWQIKEPIQSTLEIQQDRIIIDGKTITTNSSSAFIQTLFHSLLNGDEQAIFKHFAITTKQKPPLWIFVLTPISNTVKKAIENIEISGQQHLESVLIFEAQHNQTLIRFSNITTIQSND